ncbi:thiol-disulfide oxidoreductase ResA [Ureibacillus manganicus]|uniref:Thiol-disulfide oxidoreductase n=1 Tax=Ureibacillus manganicus DSM 26584 TaxID=1384049 RepID=A0A0A3I4C8_9BACL|nr:thiol-disulfide oxidoreductase ResA [Ureibacillus manganicus]KGR79594.1 thiol-disulfide oxidoreductase [Ureibacillus manganicus DSM 26584]
MDKKRKRSIIRGVILAVLLVAIGFTIYSSFTKDKVELLAVGDTAPDFELVGLDGTKHRLSDYRGEGVMLNFWGTWCEPCKREMPAMDRQYEAFKDQGVNLLTINIAQSEFEVQNFLNNLGVDFPTVIDKTRDVMTAYNVIDLPASIFINPDGKVLKIKTGEMKEADIISHMEMIKPE